MGDTSTQNHILLIDDEVLIVEFLTTVLTGEGFIVDSALTGGDGLEQFHSTTPDLIILDWRLPDLDGIAICQELRAASAVPILMLTAMDKAGDAVTGLEAGADDYLPKPFSARELLARIRRLLRRSATG
jgi:DNA-binding response OmpR family regulator